MTFTHHPPTIATSLYRPSLQGCFEHIGHAIDSYTWGISWFGFAILMWTVRDGAPGAVEEGPVGVQGCGCGLGGGWWFELEHPISSFAHLAPCDAGGHVFLHHSLKMKRRPYIHLCLKLLPLSCTWAFPPPPAPCTSATAHPCLPPSIFPSCNPKVPS